MSDKTKTTAARAFVNRLRAKLDNDRAFAAKLRRAAGRRIAESGMALEWYSFLEKGHTPFAQANRDEKAFMLATLCAYDRGFYRSAPSAEVGQIENDGVQSDDFAAAGAPSDFGQTLRRAHRISSTTEEPGVARRLAILLDADLSHDAQGSLPWRLRQAVKLVVGRPGCRIDWSQLLADLYSWDHPDRFVQKRWARSYYAVGENIPDRDAAPVQNG